MKTVHTDGSSCEARLEAVTLAWYISEPAFFLAYCTHTLIQNRDIDVPFRTGQMRIEYNPDKIAPLDDTQLEQYFRREILAILFGYPYLDHVHAAEIQKNFSIALWENDKQSYCRVTSAVNQITDWGTNAGTVKEQVQVSSSTPFSCRTVLRQFRASLRSNKRSLTRMKPNRRTGFAYMGSRYDSSARLLAAVDVSGSIPSPDISKFYKIITGLFTYGVPSVEVIQFDSQIRNGPVTLRKACANITVSGRGGTSYEQVFSFIIQHPPRAADAYDGILIFTDGNAKAPYIPEHFRQEHRVVWICSSRKAFEQNYDWMQKSGSACFIH